MKTAFDRSNTVKVLFFSVGYLTTLSVSRLYIVDDRPINECETVGGMRTGMINRSTRRKPGTVPLCDHKSHTG
jgi:hypothetical protein